jgi:hypothetical protein
MRRKKIGFNNAKNKNVMKYVTTHIAYQEFHTKLIEPKCRTHSDDPKKYKPNVVNSSLSHGFHQCKQVGIH